MRKFRKAYSLSTRVIPAGSWRLAATVVVAVAIAAIGWALFQSGAEPACAQGQSCSPGTTNKTTICHVPPGSAQNRETRCVANSAVAAHLAEHPGDREGACPGGPTLSVCSPVTVTQLHGPDLMGNSRLARIEAGKVPCLHVETSERSECVFSTGENSSGSWVEATDGNYAKTGLAISLTGEPGGEWVVAARVSDDGTVTCVAPSGNDTAGTASGVEITHACVIETALADWNATGLPLVNYAYLEVCTSSNPHPDGAELTRSFVTYTTDGRLTTTYCYKFEGAALNDRNGTERDEHDIYLPEPERCHVIWSGGYEVPGAKRPATAYGAVRPNTPILWRSVANNINIANSFDR